MGKHSNIIMLKDYTLEELQATISDASDMVNLYWSKGYFLPSGGKSILSLMRATSSRLWSL